MTSGAVVRALSDEALMNAVSDTGIRLRDIGHDQIDGITEQDIPEWEGWVPLKWNLQVVHLFLQAHDAFDLATGALRTRASPPALGVLRFIGEAYVGARGHLSLDLGPTTVALRGHAPRSRHGRG